MYLTEQPLFKNKTFWLAVSLAMLDAASANVCRIYGLSIILSNYPPTALIYYLVLQAIVAAILRSLGVRFLSKNFKKSALIQYAIFVLCFLVALLFMQYKIHAVPFIVAVVTSGIVSLASIITWSILALAFGMREYKTVAKYCNQASYLSSIIFCFFVPFLLLFFSNISLLIFATLILILCSINILVLPLHNIEKKTKLNKKIKPKTVKFPLYYYMMFFSLFMLTTTVLCLYIAQVELGMYYKNEQLSSFFGYFSGVNAVLGFLVSSTSDKMVTRLGLRGLLFSIPLIALILSLAAIAYPTFWSFIILGGIRSVFGGTYGAYSMEVVLNILPENIRFITKSNIKSTSGTFSTLILLVFTIGKTSALYLTWWIPPLSIITLFFAHKVTQYYKITLQQESAFKRFNILDEITPTNREILKDIALNAIKNHYTYTIFYGLDLINKLYVSEAPPESIYDLLYHKSPMVRSAIIKLIHSKKWKQALPFLIKKMSKEKDAEIQRQLIEEIAYLDLNAALKISEKNAHALFKPVLENLNCLLLGKNEKKGDAYFTSLCKNQNPLLRKMAASLIGTYKIKHVSSQLKILIVDEDPNVRHEALRSAALIQEQSLIPSLIDSLLENKNLQTQSSLLAFGKEVIPFIMPKVFKIRPCKRIIKLISKIPGKEAEEALITIAAEGSLYHRSLVAKYANRRAFKFSIDETFKKKAGVMMEEEISMFFYLQKQLKINKLQPLQTEILCRMILVKTLFIQWLAIATSPREVNQLIASLIQNKDEQIFDKALELLELYVHDMKLKSYIAFLFENKALEKNAPLPRPYTDHCLEQMMTTEESPLLSTVFELRSVRLFQDLPAEILLALAEEIQYLNFDAKEVIFDKNDLSDGLYCVTQGEVAIIRDEKTVTTIGPHGFFGELALLDDEPRVASAIAQTASTLIFIEKDVFNRIADDVPDVLRAVIKVILEYLRINLRQRT